MIDTHCHLDFDVLSCDLPQVLQRAQSVGVNQFINPATDSTNWPKIYALSQQYNNIYPAYGIHPWFVKKDELPKLQAWMKTHQAIAIGECGLDFYHTKQDADLQVEVFAMQIELALKSNLPLIIHSRKAVDAVYNLLKQYHVTKAVFHGFAGSEQQAMNIIAQGWYLGVGARVTTLLADLPLEYILLETDSPDQVREPSNIKYIAQELAGLKKIDEAELIAQCQHNANKLFSLNG